MEKIVENGLNSIRVGLEDYERGLADNNDARLTSAIRNIYAGILLLAKGKLYELSPADTPGILIRVLRPKLVNGRMELAPEGRKTIRFEEIKERFKHFGLPFDWREVERIRDIRNDIEHFYHDGSRSGVQEALSDTAVAVRGMLTLLKLDPIYDLGERWWTMLLRHKRLFDDERAACQQSFAAIRWLNGTAKAASRHLSCAECRSQLIRQSDVSNTDQLDMSLSCVACGAQEDIGPALERALERQYFSVLYEWQTRGGEAPIVRCPRCLAQALVVGTSECAACGRQLSADTKWCTACRTPWTDAETRSNTHECPVLTVS